MAKKKINPQELLDAAEELLLERGYSGFHFGALSEKLGIGRSTIYEYFSDKDELITAYMDQVMNRVIEDCRECAPLSGLNRLKGYLNVFLRYTQIQRIIQILPMLDLSASPEGGEAVARLIEQHRLIHRWIVEAIEEAKSMGEIRSDQSTRLIAAMIFSSIQLPDVMQGESVTGEMVIDLLYQGLHPDNGSPNR